MRAGEFAKLRSQDEAPKKLDGETKKLVEVLKLASQVLVSGRGDDTKHGYKYEMVPGGVKIFAGRPKIAALAGVYAKVVENPMDYGYPFDPAKVAGKNTGSGSFLLTLK